MPKNIVLLSDGTGNSSGKLLKTNVWRVYESLDLDDPNEQVSCYDDGVGSSSSKPLACSFVMTRVLLDGVGRVAILAHARKRR